LSRQYATTQDLLPPDGPSLEQIRSLLGQIFSETLWYYVAEGADPDRTDPPSALEQLRFAVISEQLNVRTPWYHHYYYPFLQMLLEPFDDWLLQHLGFTISDAVDFAQRIPDILSARLIARRNASRSSEKELKAAFRRYRKTGERDPSFPLELLEELSTLPEKRALRRSRNLAVMWTFASLGQTLSLSAEELAETAQRPSERAAAFLRTFCLDFGTVLDRAMPQPLHPLHLRPFAHHDGRYLPAGGALLDVA